MFFRGFFIVFSLQKKKRKVGANVIEILKRGGQTDFFTEEKVQKVLVRESEGLSYVDLDRVLEIVNGNVYAGMSTAELYDTLILAVTSLFEEDPAYDVLASRLFLKKIYKEVAHKTIKNGTHYQQLFVENIKEGVAQDIYDKRLLDFNLEELAGHLCVERDSLLKYMGLRTLYERYFVQINNRRSETPQAFWMRVAAGIAILEKDKEGKAIEFYDTISQLFVVPSTPTLFHSGLVHSQLASCVLNSVEDDLSHIFKVMGDNAQLSKYSAGIGTHWTKVRGTGALIKSTRVESQGIIPFLKIANDTTLAISRSGKRRGAACVYCENWHYDIEDFIDLRKNTGDERRRTHDLNCALWVSDLFMQRVQEDGYWTLFSPDEVSDLPEIYGRKFKERYEYYEEMARQGEIKLHKRMKAKDLWKKMITALFEQGGPWITWKDPSNIRSAQQHVGVIHGSNLCTEILENTSAERTSVCTLSSINLSRFVKNNKIDRKGIRTATRTGIRMLDNTIDLCFYPTIEAKNTHLMDRPLGFGQMGWQDMLYQLDIEFESKEAQKLADELSEFISYEAILASIELAQERGAYGSFEGSNWFKGILPIDTIEWVEKERGEDILIDRDSLLDWDVLREKTRSGMRNSCLLALAPTACCLGTNFIETTNGFKTYYKILEEMHVDWEQIEEEGVAKWIYIDEFTLPTLHSEDVCNKIWYNGKQPTFKVTFEDCIGYGFTGNHQILLNKHDFQVFSYVWDLKEGDMAVGRYGNIAVRSVEKHGIHHTWDIETVRTHHYLLSNGIVSHNTISNISGCFPCIEPAFANMYVKSNRNGEFTVINSYLVEDLKDLGLWGREMIDKIKLNNGSIQQIKEIPPHIRRKYKTVFEIDMKKANVSTALRAKWIDQSQSYNIFYPGKSGKALSDIYFDAWRRGIKTTYYLRTTSDQKAEKATLSLSQTHGEQARSCSIDNPECENCQ
jgi:ribonucleoside-diphosphate reductase alpha chain